MYIHVELPYLGKLSPSLNKEPVHIKNEVRRIRTDPGRRLTAWLPDLPQLVQENMAAVYNGSLLQCLYHSQYEMSAASYGFKVTQSNGDDIKKHQYFLAIAREIQQSLSKQSGNPNGNREPKRAVPGSSGFTVSLQMERLMTDETETG